MQKLENFIVATLATALVAIGFCLLCYAVACFIKLDVVLVPWETVRAWFAVSWAIVIIKMN